MIIRAMFSFAFLHVVVACGAAPSSSDLSIEKSNVEAWEQRFDRALVADEESGIQVAESAATETRAITNWKTILMTGDDSINAFDNARVKLHEIFGDYGVNSFIQLSRDSGAQTDGVRPTSIANFQTAVSELNPAETEGCLVHMTSHGSTSGFYIRGGGTLTPNQVDSWLQQECGEVPTIMLISACYSGVFAEPSLQAPNRIILTAARRDRTSFGCSAGAEYTYWDSCLIDTLATADTWLQLAEQVETCIEAKESRMGYRRSYPQARFGAEVADLRLFNK